MKSVLSARTVAAAIRGCRTRQETSMSGALPRRTFLVASATAVGGLHSKAATEKEPSMTTSGFWPNGARLAGSLSLMFEGGGQPISGAGGGIPGPDENG